MNADRLRAAILAATVLLGVVVAGGACSSGEGASGGSGQPASSGAQGPAASGRAAPPAPDRDAPPPEWLPPGYTEIPWEKAAELIHRRDVDRVIRTQTRRAYVVTRNGDKHFTVEPSRGALQTLIREADDGTFLHYEEHEIPWHEAAAHIREGRASGVSILHFRMVMVTLKGRGGTRFAIAPGEEEVRKVLSEARPLIEPTIE